jgi:hypothetical protein
VGSLRPTTQICSLAAGAALYLGASALVWTLVGMLHGWSAGRGLALGLVCGLASAGAGALGHALVARRARRRRTDAA